MNIYRRIRLLVLCLVTCAVTSSVSAQTKARTNFCFFTVKDCGGCAKEVAKVRGASWFFKDTNEEFAFSRRCTTRESDSNYLSFSHDGAPTGKIKNVAVGQAQTQATGQDTHELAKKLSNPVASLISVPFQQNFDFGMGAGSGWRSTLNIQPVIPISLSPKWNLISRTILPIIHQHNVVPNSSQTGLGDITQSFFFSPTDSKRVIWGAGPVLLIPTATNDALGTEKFGIGPTALVLKQQSVWTYGALVNHIWSVAGSDTRSDVNSTFLQPFLAYNTKDAWTFTVNTESSYDWEGNHWNVPIHFVITKLIKIGHQPVSVGGGIRCWAASSPGGPENCGLRMIFTPLFPR